MLITSTETRSAERAERGGDAAGLNLRCFSKPPTVEENWEAFIVAGSLDIVSEVVCAGLATEMRDLEHQDERRAVVGHPPLRNTCTESFWTRECRNFISSGHFSIPRPSTSDRTSRIRLGREEAAGNY
jgi:hypothetical protein